MDAHVSVAALALVALCSAGIPPAGTAAPTCLPPCASSPVSSESTLRSVPSMLAQPSAENEAEENPATSCSSASSAAPTAFHRSVDGPSAMILSSPHSDDDEIRQAAEILMLMHYSDRPGAYEEACSRAKRRPKLTLRVGSPASQAVPQSAPKADKAPAKRKRPAPPKEKPEKEPEEEKVVVTRSGRTVKRRKLEE